MRRLLTARHLVLALLVLTYLGGGGWWLFGPSGTRVELARLSWRLEIEVERHRAEQESAWCDQLPAGAQELGRRLVTDPTGQRRGEQPLCRYTVQAWRVSWLARSTGVAGQAPHWPAPPLQAAERLGRREAFYEALLRSRDGQEWTCRLDLTAWQALQPGQTMRLQVDRWGVAHCASLRPSWA